MKLCVIVPAKNEGLVLEGTLSSLLTADVSPKDIFVVDDGSSDNTGAIARHLGVMLLRNETNIGKAQSIARVVKHFKLTSRYDLIALMDADTRVDPQYFTAVKQRFAGDEEVAVVCGQAKSSPHNWLTAYRCLVYFLSQFIYKDGQSNMGVITVAAGCATTYRSDIFEELEWNNDTLVEDMDSTVQVHRKRLGAIVYEKNAVVHTQDPKTLRDYIKQMSRWYTGTWQVFKKYRMLTGTKKIDWEYKLLTGEGLIFSIAYALLPLLLLVFPKLIFMLIFDICFTVLMALVVSIVEKRKDVALYAPAFLFIRYVDCVVFLYTFWNTVVRRQQALKWFSVERYHQQIQRSQE